MNEKLLVFGGFGDSKQRFDDLHEYDIASGTWKQLNATGTTPPAMYLHTAAAHGHHCYVYGGNISSEHKNHTSVYCYNQRSNRWSVLAASGDAPTARFGHASTVLAGKMFVAGGTTATSRMLNDFYAFDILTNQWERLPNMPASLGYHSMVAHEHKLYVLSGFDGTGYASDIFVYDPAVASWSTLGGVGGQVPERRCGVACAVVGDNMYMFGGYAASGHDNRVYKFDFNTKQWEAIAIMRGGSPIARAYLQGVAVGGVFYVFGGYDGTKCLRDFYQIRIKALDDVVELGSEVHKLSVENQVELVMRHFDHDRDGKLSKVELHSVLENLQKTSQPAVVEEYAFSTAIVADVVQLGFERKLVIACMQDMHSSGFDVTNLNLVLDKVVDFELATEADKLSLAPPSLDRKKSERSHYREKYEQLLEERKDAQMCTICYENTMDCAILPCGHLIMCEECVTSFSEADRVCPMCRNTIQGKFKVFWT
jgi:N-acetylneuraminic acid mutarotase